MNSVFLSGNLGADPEIRYTQSGTAVCTVNVATNENWKNRETGEKEQRTEWHRLVIWGKRGENFAEYFGKGDGVITRGKLQTRSWDDRDGNKRYTTEVVVQEWSFPPGKSANRPPEHKDEDAPPYIPGEPEQPDLIPGLHNPPPPDDDEIPF